MDQTLSNELLHKDIVQMQRLARKGRTFLIQKITKRIKLLKNKKGNELQLKKNQRKIERLLQRISDMKELDIVSVVSELAKLNFKISADEQSNTRDWFMYELTQGKSSFGFMSFVNSLSESTWDSVPKSVDQSLKTKGVSEKDSLNKVALYIERKDEVLNDIIKVKKNRPGQRARQKQWEEVYGKGAKHLTKEKTIKCKNSAGSFNAANVKNFKRKREKRGNEDQAKIKVEHPSWLAKKQQSSLSSKIDVFSGKRTVLADD